MDEEAWDWWKWFLSMIVAFLLGACGAAAVLMKVLLR